MISKKVISNKDYLYERLPRLYKDFDEKLQLKRYLQCLWDNGFKTVLEDSERILEVSNPLTCPEQFIPYLCYSYGLPYYQDIPAKYQRRLLSNIVELYRRKGTKSVVTYLARELTGCKAKVTNCGNRVYDIVLEVYEASDLVSPKDIFMRYLPLFIPVNVTIRVVQAFGDEEIYEIQGLDDYCIDNIIDYLDEMYYTTPEDEEFIDSIVDTYFESTNIRGLPPQVGTGNLNEFPGKLSSTFRLNNLPECNTFRLKNMSSILNDRNFTLSMNAVLNVINGCDVIEQDGHTLERLY